MNGWLSTLPKGVIATAAIIAGTILIVLNNPPLTVCDTQLGIFKEAQGKFLFGSVQSGIKKKAEVVEFFELCKRSNSPGGCFELFIRLQGMVEDLESVPKSCAQEAGQIAEVNHWLWGSLELMVRLAWGEREPASYTSRQGWLDRSDIAIFCKLQAAAIRLYGKERLDQFRSYMTAKLPRQGQLTTKDIWERSIMSSRCDLFR